MVITIVTLILVNLSSLSVFKENYLRFEIRKSHFLPLCFLTTQDFLKSICFFLFSSFVLLYYRLKMLVLLAFLSFCTYTLSLLILIVVVVLVVIVLFVVVVDLINNFVVAVVAAAVHIRI